MTLAESRRTDSSGSPKNDPLQRALALPSGASLHRCALQVNPHHYSGTFRGKPTPGDAAEYARSVVEEAVRLRISVLAITDHNDVGSVPAFRAAAQDRGVYVFPGFELASSEGVHVLCIYPPATDQDQLSRYLGECGIRRVGASSDLSCLTFLNVLDKVRDQGGIAIAAHVTNDGGLFEKLDGQSRIQAWRHKDLLAIQIPGTVAELPHDVRQIVENKNVEYRRTDSAEHELAIAVVNAKDVDKPEALQDRRATCWIKMSEVSIEGLRQAFLDPGSRIRLNPAIGDLQTEARAQLVALTWEGGFLDGAAVHFSPDLNVLIGGRGTGKSTIIETVRAVLGMDAIGEDARAAHEGIVRHVLRAGTKVSLLVSVSRPATSEYRIERTIPNPPIVKDQSGEVSNLTPSEVLPGVQVFGQHEISELTKSREKLTHLLHRFVDHDDDALRRSKDLERELAKNRRSLLEASAELKQIEERLAALPGLEETLKRFRDAGLEERLREKSLLVREERLLDSVPDRMRAIRDCAEALRRELPLDRAFVSAKALEDLPGRAILAGLNAVFEALERDLQRIGADLAEALKRAEQGVAAVRIQWSTRKQAVEQAYAAILRDLQKSRVDGEEFIRLRRQIEELRPLSERQALLQRTVAEHSDRRRSLLADWEDLKGEDYRRLESAAKKVSRKLRDRVEVKVLAAGNRQPLFDLLEEVGGRKSEAIKALAEAADISLPEFVKASRAGATVLAKVYSMPVAQAERLAGASSDLLMRVEELRLPPTTVIRLNTAPLGEPPTWQTLEDLSTGQKATAVLLLLLLLDDDAAPLLVDQPEDDLDNRFITEGVVPRMREEKQRRQFVFSTHNANIPVLGDAELIVGLSARGEAHDGRARIDPAHLGSIDSKPVREFVEEILEGGKEAFERRRRKYGF